MRWLRLDAGRHPADGLLEQLVRELTLNSEEFTRWWTERTVHRRTHGRKRFHHHLVGEPARDFEALSLPGDPDQTFFVHSAEAGSTSRERLTVLASWVADSAVRQAAPRGTDGRPQRSAVAHAVGITVSSNIHLEILVKNAFRAADATGDRPPGPWRTSCSVAGTSLSVAPLPSLAPPDGSSAHPAWSPLPPSRR